jgi:glycosyltransferase involved in cell wall biosynthesis
VLTQTLPASEVIVVDDHSSDDTATVVEGYAARGVRYERATRRGAQAARNQGARSAASPWIAFQDSDDLWLPDKLQRQVAALNAAGFDSDVVVHGDGLKRPAGGGADEPLAVPLTEGDSFIELLRRPAPMFQALLVSRSALERCGWLDEHCPSYQEWDTSIRLARDCRFVHIREPLFIWIWHDAPTISKDLRRSVQGYNYVLDTWRDQIILAHGARHWRQEKLLRAVEAMRGGLWDETLPHLRNVGEQPAVQLARALCQRRFAPRGIGRLLRLLA